MNVEALQFLKEVHDLSLEQALNLRFDKQHPWHRNMLALYGSMIEMLGAIICVYDGKAFIGMKPIFRSYLETYVEFRNLSRDRDYGNYMEASYLTQWSKIYRSAVEEQNPFLAAIASAPEIGKERERNAKELEALKARGYSELSIFDRFDRADMANEYRSIYNFLSNESHSNIRSLISRHIEIDEKNEDFHVVFYREWDDDEFTLYLTEAGRMALDVGMNIHALLESKRESVFEKKRGQYDVLLEKLFT